MMPRHARSFNCPVLLGLILLLGLSPSAHAARYHVKPGGAGSQNGSSWANASGDLQAMINVANGTDLVED